MSVKICIFKISFLTSLAVLFVGCYSAKRTTSTNAGASTVTSVYEGMPAAELIELAGEPQQLRQVDPPREGFEIWVYRRSMKNVEYKAITTEKIPFFDPISGEYLPLIEPVFQPETTSLSVETQYLIANGAVVSWKSKREVGRDYD